MAVLTARVLGVCGANSIDDTENETWGNCQVTRPGTGHRARLWWLMVAFFCFLRSNVKGATQESMKSSTKQGLRASGKVRKSWKALPLPRVWMVKPARGVLGV